MTTPIRIQRKHAKGWRLPPNTVCINRPSKFGNPFRWQELREVNAAYTPGNAKAQCTIDFREWLDGSFSNWEGPPSEQARRSILESLHELKGKNVACYCPVWAVCHGDILLELANANPP